jgi:hypothetical protein
VRERAARESGGDASGDPIRVLVADDHALYRRGLEMVLNQEPGIEIIGEASAAASPLAAKNAASTLSSFGEVATFTVDTPCFSKQEADAIAKAKLGELSMSYITGDAEVTGHNGIKPGIVVKLTVNLKTASDRFNGKYLVRGCTHHYSHQKGEDGGYKTIIRVGRDGDTPS